LAQQLIEAWGFMACLADLFGAPPFSMEALLGGLLQGACSPLLGLVHVLLLRQAQADMEEAHATGVLQVGGLDVVKDYFERCKRYGDEQHLDLVK
jgi:hypothetical protein